MTSATLRLKNPQEALALFGENDGTLRKIRELIAARLSARGDVITLSGTSEEVSHAEVFLRDLISIIRQGGRVEDVLEKSSAMALEGKSLSAETVSQEAWQLPNRLRPKTPGQKTYLDAIYNNDIVFGIGPAGTGKSYLAVAMAVSYLKARKVKRIVLTRPAVEAGERLGFLPGDLQAKIDPYLRPLYDALYDMIEIDKFESYLSSKTIEIAPLAYMRGRAQPLHSRILTPMGWRTMGSLEIGDYVIGSGGQSTQVLSVFPQGTKPVYRMTFSDGSSTLCCQEHLWTVKVSDGSTVTCDTGELMEHLGTDGMEFSLPNLAPVHFSAQNLDTDPYVLGALLRSGLTPGARDFPETMGKELVTEVCKALNAYRGIEVTPDGLPGSSRQTALLKATEMLQGCAMSLEGSALLPEACLCNALNVRISALQGLLDAHGNVEPSTGFIEYGASSHEQADQVVALVRSLGGFAHRVSDQDDLRLAFPKGTTWLPFRMPSKLEAYQAVKRPECQRTLCSIEPFGETETQCIRVSAEDSLYVTDDYILTHNTLNDAFIILDEAQNTTPEQMKMFLTRMGFSSKVIVTGDVTQVDLPKHQKSGLAVAQSILSGIEGIQFHRFTDSDVVRHPLVGRIIRAYEKAEEND